MVQRAQSFAVFPLRLPHAGFAEGLPWTKAVYWEQDVAVDSAGELLDLIQGTGLNRFDQMLSSMAAAGMLGQASAAVIGARSALLSPATAPEVASLGITRRSLPFLDWGGQRQGLLLDATYPPYSSPAEWVSHAEQLVSEARGFSRGAVRAACGAGGGAGKGCVGLRGGGLAAARFQSVPHQTAAHQRYMGEALSLRDEQEATILTSGLEVGLVGGEGAAVAQAWAADVLSRPRASVGVLRFAAALYSALRRPGDADTAAIAETVVEQSRAEIRSVVAVLAGRSQPVAASQRELSNTSSAGLLLDQLRPLVQTGTAFALVSAYRNPLSADAHVFLSQGLGLLGESEAAVVAAVRAMMLNKREIAACVRLSKLFARSAVDRVILHGREDKGRTRDATSQGAKPPPSLLMRVLTGRLGALYDTLISQSRTSERFARLPDLLREAAGARGQLSELGPLTTFGLWGDMAASRRVLAECSVRAGEAFALARSPDQTTDASGQLFEIAVLSRAFGVQRSVDVFRIIPQSAKSNKVPLDDMKWSDGIPPPRPGSRNNTVSVATELAEWLGLDMLKFDADPSPVGRTRDQGKRAPMATAMASEAAHGDGESSNQGPVGESDAAEQDEWGELDWEGVMDLF